MIDSLIANKYANAAFVIAKKLSLVDRFIADLETFLKYLSSNAVKELSNPAIPKKILTAIISDLTIKLSIHQVVTSFLVLVARSGRIKFLPSINQSFKSLVKKDKKILEVELFSALEPTKEQLSMVMSALEKRYPGQTIEIKVSIKQEILGGVVVKVNSLVIDASLKNQLTNIMTECNSIIYQS